MTSGVLAGVRILEFAGIGPGPYAGMLLADMGAEIVRIDRRGGADWPNLLIVSRGRSSIQVDLKDPADVAICLDAIAQADVLIEGFRPGVMERLGLGPDVACARNPRLIYGRVTGWGQTGPLARVAGHDINYLAVSGALGLLGAPDTPPAPPVNLLGDYAGGSTFLVMGILAALFERERSGLGQVIDAAIVDGVASMMAPLLGMESAGLLTLGRDGNMLGGTLAPHYRCYPCADGGHIAIGPLEPRFRASLLQALDVDVADIGDLDDAAQWAAAHERLTVIFLTRTRDDWASDYALADMCLSPVLSIAEAAAHPHLVARQTYVPGDTPQPAAAPRFSRSSAAPRDHCPRDGEGGAETLRGWGVPVHDKLMEASS